MASSESPLAMVPAWARVIGLVGVPSAIAMFLVYVLASFATTGVTELHRQMDTQASTLQQHELASQREAQTQTMRLEALTRVLLRICLNTSRTEEDQQRCLSDR